MAPSDSIRKVAFEKIAWLIRNLDIVGGGDIPEPSHEPTIWVLGRNHIPGVSDVIILDAELHLEYPTIDTGLTLTSPTLDLVRGIIRTMHRFREDHIAAPAIDDISIPLLRIFPEPPDRIHR